MSKVIVRYIKRNNMSRYKEHPIYGMAVPAPDNRWYSRGLVFDRDLNQTIEIKRIESKKRTFKTKKQAEQYALDLCKAWIDKQLSTLHKPGAAIVS